mmetsp:Transcript_17214/g.37356  ORF Transcript_17214/g.37356 Transcript_17214/m.37356 type:complete len:262 (+) Transcript_17214:161-946(+)
MGIPPSRKVHTGHHDIQPRKFRPRGQTTLSQNAFHRQEANPTSPTTGRTSTLRQSPRSLLRRPRIGNGRNRTRRPPERGATPGIDGRRRRRRSSLRSERNHGSESRDGRERRGDECILASGSARRPTSRSDVSAIPRSRQQQQQRRRSHPFHESRYRIRSFLLRAISIQPARERRRRRRRRRQRPELRRRLRYLASTGGRFVVVVVFRNQHHGNDLGGNVRGGIAPRAHGKSTTARDTAADEHDGRVRQERRRRQSSRRRE